VKLRTALAALAFFALLALAYADCQRTDDDVEQALELSMRVLP